MFDQVQTMLCLLRYKQCYVCPVTNNAIIVQVITMLCLSRYKQRAPGDDAASASRVPRQGSQQPVLCAHRPGSHTPRQRHPHPLPPPLRPPDPQPGRHRRAALLHGRLSRRQEQYVGSIASFFFLTFRQASQISNELEN